MIHRFTGHVVAVVALLGSGPAWASPADINFAALSPKLPSTQAVAPGSQAVDAEQQGRNLGCFVEEQSYALFCRGPLDIKSYETTMFASEDGDRGRYQLEVTLSFQPHTRGAGLRGADLAPGTCAWADRAVSAGEGNRIGWTYDTLSQSGRGSELSRGTWDPATGSESWRLIKECMGETNCRFAVCARGRDGGLTTRSPNSVSIFRDPPTAP